MGKEECPFLGETKLNVKFKNSLLQRSFMWLLVLKQSLVWHQPQTVTRNSFEFANHTDTVEARHDPNQILFQPTGFVGINGE